MITTATGRFSRACWQKLTPLPSNLRVLRLSYSEQGPHKSWLLDHLASLSHLVDASNSELEHLALTRIVAGDGKGKALVPGSHHLARYPIDPVLDPRALTLGEKDLDALVGGGEGGGEGGEGGREWRKLELDLFRIEQDQLKRILEGCTKLKSLKVMFDAPFRNLVSSISRVLSSSSRIFELGGTSLSLCPCGSLSCYRGADGN